ncbi:hypothetical protein Asd1617_01934 [Shigella dysenteriae 1617]|uniref:Uncharacterized protein n=1 Tax=Shigella dysenteriae 1617 TaxID=754093 RepID=A0A0A6ZT27_SHIDY|nr:hypothetical protein Asd1617_01934 [Shigella dysenteriae 1617]
MVVSAIASTPQYNFYFVCIIFDTFTRLIIISEELFD